MAYEVVDSFRTVETFGGLDSRDVQRVLVRAIPSGVAFYVQFSPNEATFDDPERLSRATAAIAEPYVGYVNAAMATPGVQGIYAYDDWNYSNSVETRWVVTFGADRNGPVIQRDLAFIDIRPENFPAIVADSLAALGAIVTSGA